MIRVILTMVLFGISSFACLNQNDRKVDTDTKEEVYDGTRKLSSNIKNETCKMFNGRIECAVKNVKNRVNDKIDDARD